MREVTKNASAAAALVARAEAVEGLRNDSSAAQLSVSEWVRAERTKAVEDLNSILGSLSN